MSFTQLLNFKPAKTNIQKKKASFKSVGVKYMYFSHQTLVCGRMMRGRTFNLGLIIQLNNNILTLYILYMHGHFHSKGCLQLFVTGSKFQNVFPYIFVLKLQLEMSKLWNFFRFQKLNYCTWKTLKNKEQLWQIW